MWIGNDSHADFVKQQQRRANIQGHIPRVVVALVAAEANVVLANAPAKEEAVEHNEERVDVRVRAAKEELLRGGLQVVPCVQKLRASHGCG